MPAKGRGLNDFDPNQSDPEDETYGAPSKKVKRAPSHGPSTGNRRGRKKRRRGGYDGDDLDDDDISEDELDSLMSSDSAPESDEEELEIGPSGRPRRLAVKNTKPIIESDDDDNIDRDEEQEDGEDKAKDSAAGEDDDEDDDDEEAEKEDDQSGGARPSLWVALAALPKSASPSSVKRGSKSSHGNAGLVALSKGLSHNLESAEEDTGSRPTIAGKGPRRLSRKSIAMAEDNADDDQHSMDELQRDPAEKTIAASQEVQDEKASDAGMGGQDEDDNMVPESGGEEVDAEGENNDDDNDDDDDDEPISRRRNSRRIASGSSKAVDTADSTHAPSTVLGKRKTRSSQKGVMQESSDFEPGGDDGEDDEDDSASDESASPKKQHDEDDEDAEDTDFIGRGAKRRKPNTRSHRASNDSDEMDESDELREELADLKPDRRSRRRDTQLGLLMEEQRSRGRRTQNKVNYDILANSEAWAQAIEAADDDVPAQNTPSKRGRGGAFGRSLFSTYGPFGGAGGVPPVLGAGPYGQGFVGGVDSDSSDDETMQRPRAPGPAVGGAVGMTPTTGAMNPLFPAPPPQPLGADPNTSLFPPAAAQATPNNNLGKMTKDKLANADTDPLGVDMNVNFDAVGGLQSHIDRLKEMVALPLLYPEVFQRFHVVPPRGVLFHGPPGTGKTLLARALANSVSSEGKKVTFYMRKGADALSKWVGEAERGLRTLFEDARKNQPSIIFFDEIDGLAPVRSSKQDQIHASIVSTLLALMDGMDGRGQVIIIGATNRPDSVDPALRRPGRFDREFYFPLPNTDARRAILDIHTKAWNPALPSMFKDEIAKLTKGYGGADLRALCTEAALNAVQRRYPQIYKSNEKLQIKPETISVTAKDFMISVKKMVPSSERSTGAGAAPLPAHVEPLLRRQLKDVQVLVDEILPQTKPTTALQEAEFEDATDDRGIYAEKMQQEFDRSRVFRPRLLLKGSHGMGQQYLASALLNYFDGLHVQAFDLPTLLSDSTRSSEAAIVQLFAEVRRHKPSVIYIPHVDTWYQNVGPAVITSFRGLLRSLPPTEAVLLLGTMETDEDESASLMIKDLFGVSRRHQFEIARPDETARREFFKGLIEYIATSPADFPKPMDRKKRVLEILPPAPPEAPKPPPAPSKAELKAQKARDRYALNWLKIRIQGVMDYVKKQFRKYRLAAIPDNEIRYLLDEADPDIVTSDIHDQFRPYEKATSEHGEPGLRQTATGKFFYNLDLSIIESRLVNGYYKRPKDFLSDIKKLTKDARALDDEERYLKAKELQNSVEADMHVIEMENPAMTAEFENIYQRELKRQNEFFEKAKQRAIEDGTKPLAIESNVPPPLLLPPTEPQGPSSSDLSSGPVKLITEMPNGADGKPLVPAPSSHPSNLTNGVSSRMSDLSDLQSRALTNGTSVPSRVTSGDSQQQANSSSEKPRSGEKSVQSEASFGPSAQTRPPESWTGGPTSLEQRRSMPSSLTQEHAITPMAPGSQLADYINDASTTSSEKRQTGSSGKQETNDSDEKATEENGLASNGATVSMSGPDLSNFAERGHGSSQIADTVANTQASDGDSSSAHRHADRMETASPEMQHPSSQQQQQTPTPAVPLFNDFPATAGSASKTSSGLVDHAPKPQPDHPPYRNDDAYNEDLLSSISHDTESCSVEQLEQLYSAAMSHVWRTRGEWDRTKVAADVKRIIAEEIEDIAQFQGIGPARQAPAQAIMDVDRERGYNVAAY